MGSDATVLDVRRRPEEKEPGSQQQQQWQRACGTVNERTRRQASSFVKGRPGVDSVDSVMVAVTDCDKDPKKRR
jgi:hypothetical protein